MAPNRTQRPPGVHLLTNPLAQSYQPQRIRGALLSVLWNLLWLAIFLFSGLAAQLNRALVPVTGRYVDAAYLACFYALYAILNLPLDLWYGYLHERQFVLVKQGLRHWARSWLIGIAQHAILFLVGCTLLLAAQWHFPAQWLSAAIVLMLPVLLGSTWFAADLIPPGLFTWEPADDATRQRLAALLPANADRDLPPIILFTSDEGRDFSGGLAGLGSRQVLLISRPPSSWPPPPPCGSSFCTSWATADPITSSSRRSAPGSIWPRACS